MSNAEPKDEPVNESAAENQAESAVGEQPSSSEMGASDFKKTEAKVPSESEVEIILDIPLKVNVELGRTKILVNDLIKLHRGSVIELNKLAGEPLDLLVNDKIVAKGEVIVVNEKFGVRLTDIVSHTERIRQLGG